MPPLNFARLQSFIETVETEEGIDRLEDSEAQLWGQQLAEFDVTGEEDGDQLRMLFKSARALMEYNQAHAAAIMEEAEEQARAAGEREDKWEEEKTNLKDEISQLRDQLTAGAAYDQTGRTLRAEIDSLRDENTELKHQNRERDRELADERDKTERQLTRITELERDKNDLTNRRYQLEDTIKELNRRLSAQQETQTGKKSELDTQQKKLKERNDALLHLTSEYQNLSEENESLQKDVDRLTVAVQDATREMETTTEKYIGVKEALRVADDLVESLTKENEELRGMIEGPKVERASVYQDIMTAVDKKIEEWKTLLKGKDDEIIQYKAQVDKLHQDIAEYSVDTDRASVAALTRLVEDRDKQIQLLKNQLIKATNDMTRTTELVESLQAQMRGDGSVTMQQRITELTKRLQAKEKQTLEAQRKTREAEQAAADRDKQLVEIVARVRKYEQGEYGLEHAVQEIADYKTQINFRDKQINELTGKCSRLEVELHEVMEDNDDMRRKLGLDQRKLRAQQTTERVKKESDHALNIILRREIDKLEDERIEMKLTMRKLSQRLGQRAVALGLTADDYLAVEQFTEELRYRRAVAMSKLNSSNNFNVGGMQSISRGDFNTADLANQQGTLLNDIYKNNNALKTQLQAVEAENVGLLQALKEIQIQLSNGSSGPIQIAALDSLLARADAKHLGGSADLVSELNTKLERMTGRNEQLALDAKTLRNELHGAKADLSVSLARISKLTVEVEEANKFTFKALKLPDDIPATSSMIIMNLNEHLLHCLQEITLKTDQLTGLQQQAESFRSKLSVLKHAHGLLYAQYDTATKEWQQEKQRLADQIEKTASEFEKSKVQAQELVRLQDTLTRDENEQRRRLGEMARKFTVMRINESIMVRKYRTLEIEATTFYLEKEKVRKDAALMEAEVRNRIAYTQKQKELMSFEMASLSRSLKDAVSLADHEALRKEYQSLAEKYRQLLETDRANMQRAALDAKTEVTLKQAMKDSEMLKRTLQAEKEKTSRYEAALAESQMIGYGTYKTPADGSTESAGVEHLTKRIAMLEMKELNDRQSVEQSRHQYEKQREELRATEQRVSELERTVTDLGVANLELQRMEQSLRDELASCVTKDIYKASEGRIAELEKLEATLRADVEYYKAMTEVAQNQANYWQRDEKRRSLEVQELKACVQDIHAQTDHQAIIARLHFELLRLKLAETDTNENYVVANNRVRTLETRLLRSTERLDAKERALQHVRTEFAYQLSRTRTTITSLRTRFSGSLPLQEVEKFHAQLSTLDQDRKQIRQQLIQTIEANNDAEERLQELKLRQGGLEELMATLKEREGAQKIVEWHGQMEQLRLAELRISRSLQRTEAENKQLKDELSIFEKNISALEEANVKLKRDFENQQLQWENREAELEAKNRALQSSDLWEERQLQDMEQGVEGLTDPTLPLAVQLDNALQNLRTQLRKTNEYRKEVDELTKTRQLLTNEKRKLETQLAASDRMSVQLQSVAATSHALFQIDSSHITDNNGNASSQVERIKQMAKVSTDAYKAQLAQKDQAIESYKQLVRSLNDNMADAERRYQQQLVDVQRESEQERNDRVARMRELANGLGSSAPDQESAILEIAMLKDSVVELENANAALLAKLNDARDEIERLTAGLQVTRQQKKPSSVTQNSGILSPPKRSARPEIQRPASANENNLDSDESDIYVEKLPIAEEDEEDEEAIAEEVAPDPQQSPVESNRSSANSPSSSPPKNLSPSKADKPSSAVDRSKSPKSSIVSTKAAEVVIPVRRSSEPSKKALQWKVENDRLKKERNAAVNEKKALERALEELRIEMVGNLSQGRRSSDGNGMKDLEIKSLKQQLESAEDKAEKRGRELRKSTNEIEELKADVGELKGELVRKEGVISRLKQERIDKEREIENLERRIAHLRESVRLKMQETENRELKKKLTVLEKQMEISINTPAEKPLETSQRANEVARWTEKKRFEQHIERLKEKLASKSTELDEQKTLGDRLRRRISQLERENLVMVDRIAALSPSKTASKSDSKQPGGKSTDLKNEQDVAALRAENAQLKKNLNALQATKLEQSVVSASQLVQLKAETDRLEQQISRVSTVVVQSGSQSQLQSMGKIEQENSELRERCAELEEQLTAANNFLKKQRSGDFAKELSANEVDLLRRALADSKSDCERLTAELQLCRQELSVANAEVEELRHELSRLQDHLQMTEGDRQIRLGPIETVNRLHAVVDRLESENADLRRQVDELRLSSSRVPQDSTEMRRLLEENRGLVEENRRIKQRLEKTAPRVAWAEQLTSEEGKESKLTVDYRRLSRELRKSQLERQETLEKLADVEASHEKLREDYQRLVQISSQRRRSHPDSISGVVVLEDKLTAKEAQLQAKQERIRQLEEQLRVEVEKSHTTQYEIRRLKSAFNAQNWTPSRDLNGDELTRQIRQLKTEISRLEGENGEFKLELEALNRYIRPAVSASQLNVAQVMQRMKNYDIILTENIELKLERNGNGNGRTQRSS